METGTEWHVLTSFARIGFSSYSRVEFPVAKTNQAATAIPFTIIQNLTKPALTTNQFCNNGFLSHIGTKRDNSQTILFFIVSGLNLFSYMARLSPILDFYHFKLTLFATLSFSYH